MCGHLLLDVQAISVKRPFLDTVQDFFDQVGHQTTYASMGNKHFITK